MNKIVNMLYGSHLFGTNTKDSDTDYKGVYLPSINDCILGTVKRSIPSSTGDNKSKNKSTDIDNEYYSLQYFIKLASAGETIAIDMLHTPLSMIIYHTHMWDAISSQRSRFYTKNMKAFVGFARSQAKRYSVKGDRLAAAEEMLCFLNMETPGVKLGTLFPHISKNKHINIVTDTYNKNFLDICGRMLSEDLSVKYARKYVQEIINKYGVRSKKARDASGIDWKAISHAVRVVYEIKEILTTGDLKFPLRNAKEILEIKLGNVKYDTVMNDLDNGIIEVEELSKSSSFPDEVDTKYWDERIIEVYGI